MSNLPDPKNFQNHKMKLVENKHFSTNSTKNSIDLEKKYRGHQKAYQEQKELVRSIESLELQADVINTSTLLYELFDVEFLRSLGASNSKILNKYLGYCKYYKSLTISILDENDRVMSIASRNAWDNNGNHIKWKTYGSKSFVAAKILDSIVFLGVGTAEYVLFKLLGVDYILLQSDSMYKHISQNIIDQMMGKTLIVLSENDENFRKLIIKLKEIFHQSNVYIIDFEKILGKKLKHGYDFRDFCNGVKDVAQVKYLLEQEVLKINEG